MSIGDAHWRMQGDPDDRDREAWRSAEMQGQLEELRAALYPDPSPEQVAALDAIMYGGTLEEREAGRDALSLPDADAEDYWGRGAGDPDWGRVPDGESWADEQARLAFEEYEADRAAGAYDQPLGALDPGPLDGGEPEAQAHVGDSAEYAADHEAALGDDR